MLHGEGINEAVQKYQNLSSTKKNMLCIVLVLHCVVWWISGIGKIVSLLYTAYDTPFVILVWFLLEINSSWMAFVQLFTVTNNSRERLESVMFPLSCISIVLHAF